MTDKVQKIREEIEKIAKSINPFLPDENGKNSEYEAGCFAMATQIMQIIDSLQEEPVSEELEKFANGSSIDYRKMREYQGLRDPITLNEVEEANYEGVITGAQWQKEHLWKPADGDDLPEYNREVIALLDNGMVVFAHRPPEYWDGKDIVTGKVTRHYPKTYDKGGWNIPNVKYWLDVELPKEIEL